ncbi:hypothetical protein DERF_000742 [Dermatophagoides farinae]|uniref:Uncharacterized protein n=1 Tax=Dermatophagoides farinae TaxID=6954 RepID=A0A922LAH0_DERFA|nr:hypothetical protein DERF_000742 [Dermatophagoides farinae]
MIFDELDNFEIDVSFHFIPIIAGKLNRNNPIRLVFIGNFFFVKLKPQEESCQIEPNFYKFLTIGFEFLMCKAEEKIDPFSLISIRFDI